MTSVLLLLLQLQLPSFAIVEGNVCWRPKNNSDFDYQAKGKLRVERQECQVSNFCIFTCGLFNQQHIFKVFLFLFSSLCSSLEPQEGLACIRLSGIPLNQRFPKH